MSQWIYAAVMDACYTSKEYQSVLDLYEEVRRPSTYSLFFVTSHAKIPPGTSTIIIFIIVNTKTFVNS